jgi:hypothetical protein
VVAFRAGIVVFAFIVMKVFHVVGRLDHVELFPALAFCLNTYISEDMIISALL